MVNKRFLRKITVLLLGIIIFGIIVIKCANSGIWFGLAMIGENNKYNIRFNNGKKIYLETKTWGLNGQHYYILFSPNKKLMQEINHKGIYKISSRSILITDDTYYQNKIEEIPDDYDLLFFEEEIYIKKIEPNEIIIYVTSYDKNKQINLHKTVNDISINIVWINHNDTIVTNYNKMDINKVNVYNRKLQ